MRSLIFRNIISSAKTFEIIKSYGSSNQMIFKFKSHSIYNKFNFKVSTLVKALNKLKKKEKLWAFFNLRSYSASKILFLRNEKEKIALNIKCHEIEEKKNKELNSINMKIENINSSLENARNRENELLSKLNSKEKQIITLEHDKTEMLKKRTNNMVDQNELRQLQAKVYITCINIFILYRSKNYLKKMQNSKKRYTIQIIMLVTS